MRDIKANIRKANLNDAEALLKFVNELDRQCGALLYSEGERANTVEKARFYLEKIGSNTRSIVLIAENNIGEIIGFLCGEAPQIKRVSHTIKVNIGILKDYRRSAISRELANALFVHVVEVGIQRVEATVITNNKLSLNLCKKVGFEIEGIKRCSIKIGNNIYDEYLLSRLFNCPQKVAMEICSNILTRE